MTINLDQLSEAELIELNHKIAERLRLMHQIKSHKERWWGILTRFNRKSVTVIADNGGHWNVAPSLIRLVEENQASSPLKLIEMKG